MDTQERHKVWSEVEVCDRYLREREENTSIQKHVSESMMDVCCIACREVIEMNSFAGRDIGEIYGHF
jgi:hypothetical protein